MAQTPRFSFQKILLEAEIYAPLNEVFVLPRVVIGNGMQSLIRLGKII
jgi:hypothetical protein